MPAFLTHWRVLIETARHSQDAGSDLGSLIIDATALRRRAHGWSTPPQTSAAGAVWDTGPLPEIDFRFPGSDISAMAFLGALAPDMFYYHRSSPGMAGAHPKGRPGGKRALSWSDLFHTAHTGELLLTFLEQVALVPSPALRSQALAFALGYVSHMAADLALNPWIDRLAACLSPRHPHAHALLAMRLDAYLATTYFHHPRPGLFRQPWGGYIEPAARSLSQPAAPAAHMLQLLAGAAEIYQLGEERTEALPRDFLQGLMRLRRMLAGRGKARWLVQKYERQDRLHKTLEGLQKEAQSAPVDQVLAYATRLSEHLCRQAISYYTALRTPSAQASERSSQRATLHSDLRDWNLLTGYACADENAAEPPSSPLHNWTYFRGFWEQHAQGVVQADQHMLPTS